ncbi:hypothetical protein ANOM_004144, partial [Aspergillus nomiae NRRL 13137]
MWAMSLSRRRFVRILTPGLLYDTPARYPHSNAYPETHEVLCFIARFTTIHAGITMQSQTSLLLEAHSKSAPRTIQTSQDGASDYLARQIQNLLNGNDGTQQLQPKPAALPFVLSLYYCQPMNPWSFSPSSLKEHCHTALLSLKWLPVIHWKYPKSMRKRRSKILSPGRRLRWLPQEKYLLLEFRRDRKLSWCDVTKLSSDQFAGRSEDDISMDDTI